MKKLISEHLVSYFTYDADSPTGLRWSRSGKNRKAGDVAGTLTYQQNGKPNGIVVKIKNTPYRVNRVIWTIMVSDIPEGYFIDHLDGNPWNNKLCNLALKSPRSNTQNLSLLGNNKTGVMGVCLYTRKKTGKTIALAVVVDSNKKKIYKSFSVGKYGEKLAISLAHQWRTEKLREFNKTWAEYTERHING